MPPVVPPQVPFVAPSTASEGAAPAHSSFVVSQFHGCNIAMSWFLATDGHYKYVLTGVAGVMGVAGGVAAGVAGGVSE